MKIRFYILAVLAILIGLYPLIYIVLDTSFGLLSTKSAALLQSQIWNIFFYLHISFGGLALLVGWTQFVPKWRIKYMQAHRLVGKVYIIAVLISGIASLYIAYFATGGLPSQLGFGLLAVIWLYTTFQAFLKIKTKDIKGHQRFMIYSYAAATAAITLRIWLPLLTVLFGDFYIAYPIVAWISWIPNLTFARLIARKIV